MTYFFLQKRLKYLSSNFGKIYCECSYTGTKEFLSFLISALFPYELGPVSENWACNSPSGHITYLRVLLRFHYRKIKVGAYKGGNWSDGTLSTNRFREKLMETSFRTQQEGYFSHCALLWRRSFLHRSSF